MAYKDSSIISADAVMTLNPANSSTFVIAPNGAHTINIQGVYPKGHPFKLIFRPVPKAANYTITFGSNINTLGTLVLGNVPGKAVIISFVSDGVNYNEVDRTVGDFS